MCGIPSDEHPEREFAETVCGYFDCHGGRQQSLSGGFSERKTQ